MINSNLKSIILHVFCLTIGTLLLFSCNSNDSLSKLNSRIIEFASFDNDITQKEYETLVNEIDRRKNDDSLDFLRSESSRVVDHKKLNDHIHSILSESSIQIPNDKVWTPDSGNHHEIPFNINFYLENSASMDGYVNGVTEFETAIYNLLADLKISGAIDSLNLNYINKSIPFQKKNALRLDIQDFIEKLEPSTFKQKGGDISSSDIKNIIDTVLNVVDEKNAAILVSDFIFSPGGAANAIDYLNNQSIGLKVNFSEKLDNFDLVTVVLKLESNFDGIYYTMDDTPLQFKGRRPYYIWFLGSSSQIETLISKEIFSGIKGGYIERISFKKNQSERQPYFRIRTNPKIGNFDNSGIPNGILSNARVSNNTQNAGLFGFEIAVDFSKVFHGNDYVKDYSNYNLSNDRYKIEVKELTELEKSTQSLSNFTHILKLQTDKLEEETLNIQLVSKFPSWVIDSSLDDDSKYVTDISQLSGTFGFRYLIEGVYDAYHRTSSSNVISSISINIKK